MPDKKASTARVRAKASSARSAAKKVSTKRVRGGVAGFMTFVREQGVVGLAVGLAIGTQAGATVKTIVEGFINPIVGFAVGGVSLEQLTWNTGLTNNGKELIFGWGAIASATITLVAVAAVIYYVVKGFKLDRLDKEKA